MAVASGECVECDMLLISFAPELQKITNLRTIRIWVKKILVSGKKINLIYCVYKIKKNKKKSVMFECLS